MKYNRKFLIVGNPNAITYKEIFPFIMKNKIWLGVKSIGSDMLFDVSEHYASDLLSTGTEGSGYKIIDGVIKGRTQGIWFTNLPHDKRNEKLILYRKYSPEKYPHYDNYDAIEVSKVKDIPEDWAGTMGVPITFLDKYNPDQFEIIQFRKGDDGKDLSINGRCPYFRILIRNHNPKSR